jgi:hypothetical protein
VVRRVKPLVWLAPLYIGYELEMLRFGVLIFVCVIATVATFKALDDL